MDGGGGGLLFCVVCLFVLLLFFFVCVCVCVGFGIFWVLVRFVGCGLDILLVNIYYLFIIYLLFIYYYNALRTCLQLLILTLSLFLLNIFFFSQLLIVL